jgi:cytochrome c556
MKRAVMMSLSLLLGAGVVMAQPADPVAARKEILKGWGGAAREPGLMLRGEAAFDLPKVQNLLKLISTGSKTSRNLGAEGRVRSHFQQDWRGCRCSSHLDQG